MNLVTTKDFEHFQSLILENILRSFQEGKDRKSFFNIALTGGETVKPIYIELAKRELSILLVWMPQRGTLPKRMP